MHKGRPATGHRERAMSDDFSPIRPRSVLLSHTAPPAAEASAADNRYLTYGLAGALIIASLLLVFYLLPAWLEPAGGDAATASSPLRSGGQAASAAAEAVRPAIAADDGLPPFQQLQRAQAREQAQRALAAFVERQIQLEEAMSVGAWGADEYQAAKALAAAGDEAFVDEQFDAAIDQYRAAGEALGTLMSRGRELLERSVAEGLAALHARDQPRADTAFALAATIAPDDPRVAEGQRRAALIPEISALLRQARNEELAESWSAAEQTYARVANLDPATTGLDDARARVADGRRQDQLRALLSDGFAHLDAGRFDAARRAFQQALQLDAGNTVAEGALEQVGKRADLAELSRLRTDAERAAAEERWQDAADLYQQVLDRDSTIRFAQTGRAQALAQARSQAALQRIIDSPDRLSSDTLYEEAQTIVARAETLEPRGRRLAQQIADVRSILDTYAAPVAVLLRSDNRTRVTVSTVGELGSFAEKRLELRPGSYTVVGSRDGCRDVRTRILVRPNMTPVDIRCVDTL
jgi:tetratricopeptide (TPR) repeat protein